MSVRLYLKQIKNKIIINNNSSILFAKAVELLPSQNASFAFYSNHYMTTTKIKIQRDKVI